MSASTEKKIRSAEREAGTNKKLLAAEEEAKKKKQDKTRWTLGTIGVIILIAAILVLNSGLMYKTTAYSVGDTRFSAAEMNAYYASEYYNTVNQYGDYSAMFGLDTSAGIAGLRTSQSMFSEGTWRDYFIQSAENTLLQITALCDYAEQNGISLTDGEIAQVKDTYAQSGMAEYVKLMGYGSLDKFYAANYGNGVTEKTLISSDLRSALASKAVTSFTSGLEYSDKELADRYAGYEGAQDLYTYDYVAISAAADADGNISDAAKADAKATAEAVLAAYKDSDGDDYEQRLNDAAIAAGADVTAQRTMNQGSSLGSFSDFLTGSRKAGDASVIDSDTIYYVAVFENHDDNNYKTVSVRHILVKAQADENGVYTDAAKAEAKAKAEDILAQFNAGDKTEESFAALAEQFSEDGGSNTNGGLYKDIPRGQMVKEFNDFCFASHKPGDTGIVYGESASYAGYHVMYFVSEGETYANLIAKADLVSAAANEWLEGLQAAYTPAEGFGIRYVG